ncbi:MAG: SurA N-terminal domain-containing protein [Microgenomates group bacterium]
MQKIIIIHSVVLAIILAIAGFAYAKYWNVAIVNGRPITRLSYIKLMEKQAGKQILSQMVDDAIIMAEADAKGLKIDQAAIDEELAKIETNLKSKGQTLDAALASAGMTRDDLTGQIKLKKIQDALSASKIEVTQAKIDEFLKANKALLPTGKTRDELNTLAKNQLILEADQASATAWLDTLRASAKVIYK